MDIYSFRPSVPAEWPEKLRTWGEHCLSSERIPLSINADGTLTPRLSDAAAMDWWLPLRRVWDLAEDAASLEDLQPIDAAPEEGFVLVAWPDGSIHLGVPPRVIDDLVTLYRHARLRAEYFHDAGVSEALRDYRRLN